MRVLFKVAQDSADDDGEGEEDLLPLWVYFLL